MDARFPGDGEGGGTTQTPPPLPGGEGLQERVLSDPAGARAEPLRSVSFSFICKYIYQ